MGIGMADDAEQFDTVDYEVELTKEEILLIKELLVEFPSFLKVIRGLKALGWIGGISIRIILLAGSLATGYLVLKDTIKGFFS
jgi:hypothetical protein